MRHLVKTTVIYLLLVTPPFLGLLGIIEVGEGIAAPRSVGGEWQLDDASRQEAAAACHGIVFAKQATLKVSQSGLRAEVTLADQAKTKLDIEIAGERITGTGRAPATGGCDRPLSLEGRLERTGAEAQIIGILERRGCAGCPAVHLRAGRKPAAANP